MHVCALGLSCETLAASGPPGLHTTTREPKRAHLTPPALQTPPKFHEKTPRERQKDRTWGGEREKKTQNFWPPHPSGPPPFGAPTLLCPTFSGFWPPTLRVRTDCETTETLILAKNGLAKNGLPKNGLAKKWIWPKNGFGQNWPGPKHDVQIMDWPKNGLAQNGFSR